MKKVLFIIGTRPEAIKLAPLIKEFTDSGKYKVSVCITAQHRQILDQVLNFFKIVPDFDLNLMKPDQSLFHFTANALIALQAAFDNVKPDLVFVQGDTTTVFVGALAAYYEKVPVAYIEAGLRSFDKYSPYPEEMNRLLTTRLSDYHFVPTVQAAGNLSREGVTRNIFVVGNTVIDALQLGLSIVGKDETEYRNFFSGIDFSKRILLVTCHRRESFGEPFRQICSALTDLARKNPGIEIVYPVHLNPHVREVAYELLTAPNIKLIAPLEYPHMIWLMNKSYLILTDSGGIQEEAPALGKPVLVLRHVTERVEGLAAGTSRLVGTDRQAIVISTQLLLDNKAAYESMAKTINPYGDGTASVQIRNIIEKLIAD